MKNRRRLMDTAVPTLYLPVLVWTLRLINKLVILKYYSKYSSKCFFQIPATSDTGLSPKNPVQNTETALIDTSSNKLVRIGEKDASNKLEYGICMCICRYP